MQHHALPLEEFIITMRVRRPIESYTGHPPHLKAFRLAPNPHGESAFVYTRDGPLPAGRARINDIDEKKYCSLLDHSLKQLLTGITQETTREPPHQFPPARTE